MSKGLEALKAIRNVEVCIGNDLNTATKLFEIDHEYDKAFEIIEKELKALVIIKEKDVNIDLLRKCPYIEFYNKKVNKYRQLTKEEYDLLSEAML